MTDFTWNAKHLRFCIAQKLTPTAIKLYQWLLSEVREGYAEIVDLREFQKLVAKERGKKHDFRVIQTAVARLQEAGVLRNCRKFTNFVWKWTIRSINRLIYPIIPKPKNPELRSQIPNLQRSNNANTLEQVQAAAAAALRILPEELTSNLEINLGLLGAAGINFDSTDVPKIIGWETPDDIRAAINLFNERGGHQEISNPEGWMRKCLEHHWWESKKPSLSEALVSLAKSLDAI